MTSITPYRLSSLPEVENDESYRFALETSDSKAAQAEREAVLKGIGELDDDENAAILRKEIKKKRVLQSPMPLTFIISQLESRLASRKLSNELFIFFPFLILFLLVSIAHRDIEGAFWVSVSMSGQTGEGEVPPLESTRALRNGEVQAHHISKAFVTVKTVDEWHHWFETIIIDFFFNDPSENPPPVNNWVAGFNLKLGALRIRTLRVNNDSCIGTDFESATASCTGPFSVFNIDESNYGDFNFTECSAVYGSIGLVGVYPCSGNVFDIPWNSTHSEATALARQMNSVYTNGTDILDPYNARFIAVEFLVYTPEINEFTIVSTFMEITAGGRFIPTVRTDAFQVFAPSYQVWHTVLWCFMYVLVFYYIFKYGADFKAAVSDGHGLQWFLEGWNLMELLNMLSFFVMFIIRIIWMVESVNMNFQLPGLPTYDKRLEYIEFLFRVLVYGGAINLIITSLKVLKYVELNPQLNIVTRTLSRASENLVGILFIFFIVVSAYSLAGTSLFSNAVEEFRDFETSFSALLRILLGDFEYEPLREENRFLAGFFFWSFVILGLFMLLNFFIGAIASAFEDEVDSAPGVSLQDSIILFITSLRHTAKEFLSNPKLFVNEAISTRKSRYAEHGRLTTSVRTLKDYRVHHLQKDATEEEFEVMNDVEKDAVMPNPDVVFDDLVLIFEKTYQTEEDPNGCYAWIGEKYLKNVYLSIYRDFAARQGHSEAAEAEALQMHIQLATEEALRFTIGLTTSTEHKPSKDMVQVQELFAPTAGSMKKIGAMTQAVGKLEDHVSSLMHLVSKLDNKLSK